MHIKTQVKTPALLTCFVNDMLKLIVLLIATFVGISHGEAGLGDCPDVDPLPGLDMNKIMGYWYAIQKTDTNTPCITYNITRNEESPDRYKITLIEQHATLWSSALFHEHTVTGDLSVPNTATPAKMALDLPLDIGSTTFMVFMTDYDNYLGIFTCKKLPLLHTWSIDILSRFPILDMTFVDKIRTRISSYNINPFYLQIINQSRCAPRGHKGSIIKSVNDLGEKAVNVVNNLGAEISSLTENRAQT